MLKKGMKTLLLGLMVCAASVMLVGCGPADAQQETQEKSIKIAKQYGLAYAPITVMQELDLIEKVDPNIQVEWVQLGNTAAIREAILTDELDIGFMGIPPYLIGVENGMNWQIFTGLSRAPLGLMTNDMSIQSLEDIRADHRIALPQPGSIQHILLSMAAKRELGDAKAFDAQLVSLKHPDGVQMLLSKSDITMHFTSPPFVFQEEAEGMHKVITGEEAFGGPFTFIVGTLREEMLKEKNTVQSVRTALQDAMTYMEENPEETVALLAKAYNIDEKLLHSYLYESGIAYSQEVQGLDQFVDFMIDASYLTETVKEQPLIWKAGQ